VEAEQLQQVETELEVAERQLEIRGAVRDCGEDGLQTNEVELVGVE
jgi:hypothetical protein